MTHRTKTFLGSLLVALLVYWLSEQNLSYGLAMLAMLIVLVAFNKGEGLW